MQQTLQPESSAVMTGTLNTTLNLFLSFRCLCNQSWCKLGFTVVSSRRVPVFCDYILLFPLIFRQNARKRMSGLILNITVFRRMVYNLKFYEILCCF